jgi:hypothetical protein
MQRLQFNKIGWTEKFCEAKKGRAKRENEGFAEWLGDWADVAEPDDADSRRSIAEFQ